MKKLSVASLLILIVMTAFIIPVHATPPLDDVTFSLMAGKNIFAGSVNLDVTGVELRVTIETVNGWKLTEIHVYFDTVAPSKHSPGKFPYHYDPGGVTWFQTPVPLPSDAGSGDLVYIAIHVVVVKQINGDTWQEETGWMTGCKTFNKGWGGYLEAYIPDD